MSSMSRCWGSMSASVVMTRISVSGSVPRCMVSYWSFMVSRGRMSVTVVAVMTCSYISRCVSRSMVIQWSFMARHRGSMSGRASRGMLRCWGSMLMS